MIKKFAMMLGVASASLIAPALAHAQDTVSAVPTDTNSSFYRGRDVSVENRPHPGYEAQGTRLGDFILYPKLNTSLTYTDNVFATSTGKVSDTYGTIEPHLDLVSDWGRNALGLSAYSSTDEYFTRSSEDHTDFNVSANGRLDVTRQFNFNASAGYQHLAEPRSDIESFQSVARPVEYNVENLSIGTSDELNRLRLIGSYGWSDYSYQNDRDLNGLPVLERYRNRVDQALNAEVDYSVSPDTFVYVKATGNLHDYDEQPPAFIDRNSQGFDVALGADFDLTSLIRGHLELGYINQTFDDKALFKSLSGLSVAGDIDYFPTQLTTVNIHASRTFQDTGIPDSAGYSSTSMGVRVDHELFRNILLNAQFDYEDATQQGIDRQDNRYNASLGATYLLSRYVGITGSYSYFTQRSTGTARGTDFNINRAQLTLTLQY